MKVLILGKGGQLSTELLATQPKGIELCQWGRNDWDFLHPEEIKEPFKKLAPDVVINAAAYTGVDKAEEEKEKAEAINTVAVGAIAKACSECHSRLLHVSTDFVFDGKAGEAYLPTDPTNPLGVYGRTKLAGEREVMAALPKGGAVIRTSWLYSAHGNNFVKTMLKLMGEKDSLGVVSDQKGSPTWAKGLAMLLWKMTSNPSFSGIYHWCDAGVISWHDFSVVIQEEALKLGLIPREIPIRGIPTSEYPTPAQRPRFSALNCSTTVEEIGHQQEEWRKNLVSMLTALKADRA